MRRRIIAGLIIATGLATAGIAYAENQPADPSVPSTPSAAGAAAPEGAPKAGARAGGPKAGLKGGVLKGAIHGDLLVQGRDGTTSTVTFDRGKVTAISGGSISIERPDGVSVSKALTDQTVFNGTPRGQLQAGTAVIVVSSGDTAQRVISKGARGEAAAKACAAEPADGAGNAPRAQIKERLCQRLEKRQERRAGKGPGGPADGGGAAGESPSTAPSSMVDDGLETILS
jgi:hypothetical protein